MRIFLGIALLAFVLQSCQQKSLTAEEFQNFVRSEASGLFDRVEQGELYLEVQYKPLDLLLVENVPNASQKTLDSMRRENEKEVLYMLRIGSFTGGDVLTKGKKEKAELRKELEYAYQNKIRLKIGSEELSPNVYQLVESRGAAPFVDLMLQFSLPKKGGDYELKINDDLFGFGQQVLELTEHDRSSIPSIKSNQQ